MATTKVSREQLQALIKKGKSNATIRKETGIKISSERMNRMRKHVRLNSPDHIRNLARLGER